MVEATPIAFNFTWGALKLLGKSLYSNAWAAISELVANGIDAGATKVSVLIDLREDEYANVEVMDDGNGMDRDEITRYAVIGNDRRAGDPNFGKTTVMGRKGIGKLAALFLSSNYDIRTKTNHNHEETCWNLTFPEDTKLESRPRLTPKDKSNWNTVLSTGWNSVHSGTLLQLTRVDLSSFNQSQNRKPGFDLFDQLATRLANQFSYTGSGDHPIIELAIVTDDTEARSPNFRTVEKAIAFKNFAYILAGPDHAAIPQQILDTRVNYSLYSELHLNEGTAEGQEHLKQLKEQGKIRTVNIPNGNRSKNETDYFLHVPEVCSLDRVRDRSARGENGKYIKISGVYPSPNSNAIGLRDAPSSIPYELTGWIGIHSTINKDSADDNDPNFKKGMYYKPNSVRLYVRGKLAEDDLLGKLGITQAFVNYIEGEINFDIMDNDYLPDIATSSRQGFNELDGRWQVLTSILRPLVRDLITKRQDLKQTQRELRERQDSRRQSSAKGVVAKKLAKKAASLTSISPSERDDFLAYTVQELQGEIKAKEDYRIFISHASKDCRISDFIYHALRKKGAEETEFFYTSSRDRSKLIQSFDSLEDQIKASIISKNVFVLFIISTNFTDSEYTMFEAGASWATKGGADYRVLSLQYRDVPDYLNSALTPNLENNGEINLYGSRYTDVVTVLNILVGHLNEGRRIKQQKPIEEFKTQSKYDIDHMDEMTHEQLRSGWDPVIRDMWDEYVEQGISDQRQPICQYQGKLDLARALREEYDQGIEEIWKEGTVSDS